MTDGEKAGTKTGAKTNPELKGEFLKALFMLKNIHFHQQRFGQRKFRFGGLAYKRDGVKGDLGDPDLNMPEFALMSQLKERENAGESGGAWLTEMREYLRVSKAAVSQMLGGLERRGFITREIDPENRRTIIVRLTGTGRDMLELYERRFDDQIGTLIDRFGEKDTREIIRLIYRFADIIEGLQEDQDTEALK